MQVATAEEELIPYISAFLPCITPSVAPRPRAAPRWSPAAAGALRHGCLQSCFWSYNNLLGPRAPWQDTQTSTEKLGKKNTTVNARR